MGFTGLFGKLLPVSPAAIIAGRTVFGCLALLAVLGATRTPLRPGSRRNAARLALGGALLAGHWFAFFQAIRLSTVAIGLLAFSNFPLFVTLLEPLATRERPRAADALTALAVTAGLAIITPAFDPHGRTTQGLLWGVLSGLAYAVVSLLTRASVRHAPALTVALWQQACAALCVLPALWLVPVTLTPRTVGLLLVLGVVFTAGAQGLLVASLRHIPARTASVVIALEPVYGIVLARLFLHEVPSPRTLLGGLLICGAVLTATARGRA